MGNENFLERQKNLMDGKLKIYFSDKQNLSALKEEISEEDINCLDDKDKTYIKDFPELKTFFEQKLEKFKNKKKFMIYLKV